MTTASPKLSIIIPVYNAEKHLRQALDTVLGQSLKDIEVICVDDGSTDSSPAILEEYAARDPLIQVYWRQSGSIIVDGDVGLLPRQGDPIAASASGGQDAGQNGEQRKDYEVIRGAGAARNLGISHAHGEYLHFLDADDYVLDYAYEALYNKAVKYDLDVLKFASLAYDTVRKCFVDDPKITLSGLQAGAFNLQMTLGPETPILELQPASWNGIYRRSLLMDQGISFEETEGIADRYFSIAAITQADRMMIARDRLVVHRMPDLCAPKERTGRTDNAVAHGKGPETYLGSCLRSVELCSAFLAGEETWLDPEAQERILLPEFDNLFTWFDRCRPAAETAQPQPKDAQPKAVVQPQSQSVTYPDRQPDDQSKALSERTAGAGGASPTRGSIKELPDDRPDYVTRTASFVENYRGLFRNALERRMRNALKRLAQPAKPEAPLKEQVVRHAACAAPKVSVVVPTYNVEDYLNEALHSLSTQKLEEMEFLLVNDGSTDGSMVIMKEYAALDSRMRILDGPNGGYGKAMNRGIDAAKGEYLGILEPDDFVPPDMYSTLYPIAAKNKLDFVKAGFYRFTVNPDSTLNMKPERLTKEEKFYGRVICPRQERETFRFPMNTWSGIYRLEFLNHWKIRHNETPGASYQDNGFWFKTFTRAERAWFVDKNFYMNRRDNPNSSMFDRRKIYCVTEEYRLIREWMDQDPDWSRQFDGIYYAKKFTNFMVTYRRLAPEYQLEYLHHTCEEFRPVQEQNRMDREFLGEMLWQQYQEILADPDAYYRKIRVSVIMPVYNAAPYLHQTLDSLLVRNELQFEVICVDDGSTDDSLAILKEYEAKDPRVRVITQENAGAGAARNHGLQYARGEYLSILDADDFFEPDMLRLVYENAHYYRSDITVFRSDNYIASEGKFVPAPGTIRTDLLPEKRPFAGAEIPQDIFKAFVGWAWDKLFRTQFVRDNHLKFQDLRTSNDMLFVFSAIVRAEKITTVGTVLAHHRREASGTLSVTREKSWGCFYEALCALRAQLKEWGLYETREQDFINYSLHFALWHLHSLQGPSFYRLYDALKGGGGSDAQAPGEAAGDDSHIFDVSTGEQADGSDVSGGGWLDDLGVTMQDAPRSMDYYYNRGEYRQLVVLLSSENAEFYLFGLKAKADSDLADARRRIKSLEDERGRLKKEKEQLQKDKTRLNKKLKAIHSSASWKIARAITYLPRKVKKALKKSGKKK